VSAMRLKRCGAVASKITAFPIAAQFDPQDPRVQGARGTTEFRRQITQKQTVAAGSKESTPAVQANVSADGPEPTFRCLI
jgi:hypothetical protein